MNIRLNTKFNFSKFSLFAIVTIIIILVSAGLHEILPDTSQVSWLTEYYESMSLYDADLNIPFLSLIFAGLVAAFPRIFYQGKLISPEFQLGIPRFSRFSACSILGIPLFQTDNPWNGIWQGMILGMSTLTL